LGGVGFHCLTGRPPFEGNVAELLAQHLTRPAPTVHSLAPDVSPQLAEAIDRALAKHPDERFESAEAMAEAMAPPMPVSSELPVPVRIWVERGRELKGIYVIWSCFFFGLTTMFFVGNVANEGFSLAALFVMALGGSAVVAPWLGHALWRLNQ